MDIIEQIKQLQNEIETLKSRNSSLEAQIEMLEGDIRDALNPLPEEPLDVKALLKRIDDLVQENERLLHDRRLHVLEENKFYVITNMKAIPKFTEVLTNNHGTDVLRQLGLLFREKQYIEPTENADTNTDSTPDGA
jgi:chromosome segregation ATPase